VPLPCCIRLPCDPRTNHAPVSSLLLKVLPSLQAGFLVWPWLQDLPSRCNRCRRIETTWRLEAGAYEMSRWRRHPIARQDLVLVPSPDRLRKFETELRALLVSVRSRILEMDQSYSRKTRMTSRSEIWLRETSASRNGCPGIWKVSHSRKDRDTSLTSLP